MTTDIIVVEANIVITVAVPIEVVVVRIPAIQETVIIIPDIAVILTVIAIGIVIGTVIGTVIGIHIAIVVIIVIADLLIVKPNLGALVDRLLCVMRLSKRILRQPHLQEVANLPLFPVYNLFLFYHLVDFSFPK